VMKTSIRGHGMLLFIGVLLPDRAQQDDGPDAISNQSLNPVLVGAWWIFGWHVVSSARPGLREEDESGAASGSHWAALGHKRERGREASWATQPWLGRAQKRKRKRIGWAGSRVSWVSAHHRVGFRNYFSFSKSFYNLQTSLNPIQIRISTTSTHKIKCKNISPTKEKLCSGMKCNNQIFI
jgi:hypothetical protein